MLELDALTDLLEEMKDLC